MKKRFTGLLVFLVMVVFLGIAPGSKAFALDVAINETNFPDDSFRWFVSEYVDNDSNNSLSSSECAAVTEIDVWDTPDLYNVKSIKGVEYFTNLKYLDLAYTKIKEVDLRKHKLLAHLDLCSTPVDSIKLYSSAPLTYLNLSCAEDAYLYSVNLGNFPALKELYLEQVGFNLVGLEKLTALEVLNCSGMSNVTSLDLTANTKLKYLYCENCNLTSLKLSPLTKLERLFCAKNRLSSLDLSKNTLLKTLHCGSNALTKLAVSNNKQLEELSCQDNRISTLNLSKNTALKSIVFYGNLLKKVDISKTAYGKAPYDDCLFCYSWSYAHKDDLACTIYMTPAQKKCFTSLDAFCGYWIDDDCDGDGEDYYDTTAYSSYDELDKYYDSITSALRSDVIKGLKGYGITLALVKFSSAKLSSTSYSYDGTVKKPSVTVKNNAGTVLTKDKDYTVTYATGRKNVGKYLVTVKGKGKYDFTKKLYFKINPKKTAISSISGGKNSFTVSWQRRTTQVTGYEVKYSLYGTFKNSTTVKITSNTTTKRTVKSLKAGKKYYVKVRTYKMVNGVKFASKWSTRKTVTTK